MGTIATLDRLAAVRRDGYAWPHEEFAECLKSVAAGIEDRTGILVSTIHVHGPSNRFPGTADEGEIAARVVDAADRISARIRQANGRARASGRGPDQPGRQPSSPAATIPPLTTQGRDRRSRPRR